jgi:L-carnitine CoA-transferase
MWGNPQLPEFGVLSGVKVVHATLSVAAPFAVSLMADCGADCLWLENALSPDVTRAMGSYGFDAERKNQRNLALNVGSERGREILLDLLRDADVFLENSKGGQYAKWGLTDEVLWEVNPRLVIAHVSGFGQTGLPEYVSRPSYDPTAQAFAGYTWANRNATTAPYPVGPFVADFLTGLYTAFGICAALLKVKQTGVGESLDIAQVEVVARTQMYGPDWLTEGVEKDVAGFTSPFAGSGVYACADGSLIQTGLGGGGIFKRAVTFLGLEYGKAPFPEGMQVAMRGTEAGDVFDEALEKYLATKETAAQANDEMQAAGLTAQKLNTLLEFAEDPHIQARGTVVEWENVKGKRVRAIGPVPRFKRNPGQVWKPASLYGGDNETVLHELGVRDDEIAGLYESRVLAKDPDGRFQLPFQRFGKA